MLSRSQQAVYPADIKPDGDQIDWLSTLFFKTLIASIEFLQIIEHYTQLTSDSVTKLKSRTALQRGIDEQIAHSGVALCMVHCIDFQHVNRKFGQAKGDEVLHEIANIIDQYTRAEDISGRFGGALFGIAITATSVSDGFTLATKLQTALHNKTYLQNALRLTFDVGVGFVSEEEDKLDNTSASSLIINRTEQALKAAQNAVNPSIVQWEPDKFRLDEQDFNYLGGIFTPDNVTNYRNMLLLWDISSIIADEHTFARLLKSVIERLAFTFEFVSAGIVTVATSNDELQENFSFELSNTTDIHEINWTDFSHKQLLLETAATAIKNSQHTEHQEDGLNALLIPLGTSTQTCFFIVGDNTLLNLTHDTVMLFVGFARQLGKALKRSQLEDELNKNLEQQNAKLSQELLELKAGMQSSALVYCSSKMQKIVEQTQRAAQTDTTVLITGDSGTGKEKLIHAIHNLSPRRDKPLVIVDCGSIPESLIESELFGHKKGSFTGAQIDSKGKIEAANGGILVLDEIGELALSMQPKLLRFVQEKQYTPIGSTKSIKVDVKIVAVTNRDLAYEVSQGTFRKDLFYRLNVVTLHNPPLRERIEDIELLCQHFLSKFAHQFEMDKKQISKHTMARMKQYVWPGNVRELENKLMQASLLSTQDEILFEDLNLDSSQKITDTSNIINARDINTPITSTVITDNVTAQTSRLVKHDAENKHLDLQSHLPLTSSAWCESLGESIDRLLLGINRQIILKVSIGSAIEAMLLKMAHDKCRSHAKTALLLQLPISTTRRRLQKGLPNLIILENDQNWQDISQLLNEIVSTRIVLNTPVDTVRQIIATCILQHHYNNMGLASQLMGVSEPTMYKIRKNLNISENA